MSAQQKVQIKIYRTVLRKTHMHENSRGHIKTGKLRRLFETQTFDYNRDGRKQDI